MITIAHMHPGSLATGAQLATRGRRDMSSRVRDVVLSLALCHNVYPVYINASYMFLHAYVRLLLSRTTMEP